LIFRKISKFDATGHQVLRLNAQNSISAGELKALPLDPLTVFKGSTSKGRSGEEEGKGRVGQGQVPKYFGPEPPLLSRRETSARGCNALEIVYLPRRCPEAFDEDVSCVH